MTLALIEECKEKVILTVVEIRLMRTCGCHCDQLYVVAA